MNLLFIKIMLVNEFSRILETVFKNSYHASKGDMGEKKLKQPDRAMWVSIFIIFPVILAIVLKILFEKGWLDWTF